MAIETEIRSGAEKYIAKVLLGLVSIACLAAIYFAPDLFPASAMQQLGPNLIAQILLAQTAVFALLVVLLWSRRPQYKFNKTVGLWTDGKLFYCTKCDKTPLKESEAGWFCGKCSFMHDNDEYILKQYQRIERERAEEDRMVREANARHRV